MTPAAWLLLAATWTAIGLTGLALVGSARRHGREQAALQAKVRRLERRLDERLADLTPPPLRDDGPLRGVRSYPRAAHAGEGALPAQDVPVITGVPELDQVDLSARRVASVTLAGPLIKVAAFSYGLRHALHEEQRMRYRYAVRKELRRQRKMRRRRRGQRSRSGGWSP